MKGWSDLCLGFVKRRQTQHHLITPSVIDFTEQIMQGGVPAVLVTQGTACSCFQPCPDTFVFDREAAAAWLLPRTVEEPLGWLIFKVSDFGFDKINKKIPSVPKQGQFKDLMTGH